jgi:2-desacetyl-2-hydroxyethyl bacteriochlorophyllide A dehydrogenase
MKALVYEGPRVMNVREVPVPDPLVDEVLIRVERVGICGSELSGYLGENELRKPPLIMGHEFSGVVEKVGAGVNGIRIGDRVTVNPLMSCGNCRRCRGGTPQLCAERKVIGVARPGAFAQYVAVPAGQVVKLPDSVTMDAGALTEPLACAIHAARLARLDPADRLLVFGAGPIGLLIVRVAQIFGLTDIVVADLNKYRLQIAEAWGARSVLSADEAGKLAPQGYDVTVDAVGVEATRAASVRLARLGGRVVFSGLHDTANAMPMNIVVRNELELKGAFCYDACDFETALSWLAAGRVDLAPWTEHHPLEDGQACFERLLSNPGPVAKIVLTL